MTQPNTSSASPCEILQARGGWAEDASLHRCNFPIGPRNTWSNAAYPIAGYILVLIYHADAPSFAIFTALFALGVGSGIYHGYKTVFANTLDWMGMCMAFGALMIHGLVPVVPALPWVMLVAGAGIGYSTSYSMKGYDLNDITGILLGLSLIGAWLHGSLLLGLLSMATFIIAYIVWQLDVKKSPYVGLWGHAIWHIVTAFAIALMYGAQVSPH